MELDTKHKGELKVHFSQKLVTLLREVWMHTRTHAHTRTHTDALTNTHTHARTHKHAYTHTHTHTQRNTHGTCIYHIPSIRTRDEHSKMLCE